MREALLIGIILGLLYFIGAQYHQVVPDAAGMKNAAESLATNKEQHCLINEELDRQSGK